MKTTKFQSARWFAGMACAAVVGLAGCNDPQNDFGLPEVSVLFNAPGSATGREKETLADEILVERIRGAKSTIHAAIYGFSNRDVIEALIEAYLRGVDVRLAGDARHFLYQERGYAEIYKQHIPIQVGNQWHIMHNKFFVIDGEFVFVGTGNITSTGFGRNNNNWVYINNPYLAADFEAEFEQMFAGKFSTAKERLDNGNTYEIGDTIVETCFSPQEDCMGRIQEELDAAQNDIHFTIFAFTKDQIGSRFIRKHREFQAWNQANGQGDLPVVTLDGSPMQQKKVVGVFDRSQIHGNFLYHEAYRLVSNGIPSRMDANENSRIPGDYQAGGGRLHSKTMIIDAFGDDPRVITGSFNWSSAATIANDEVMLILRGERITQEYYREFLKMWGGGKDTDQAVCNYMKGYPVGEGPVCSRDVGPGDVIISEVHWDGWNGETDPGDHTGARADQDQDEFIELYNPTDQPINLSLWTVTNGYDFKVGFTPGTVILPGQYFLAVDHNLIPYADNTPQAGEAVFVNADYVQNLPNDPRMPRMNLSNSNLRLELRDATGELIDEAGDYGTPFAGGRFTPATNPQAKSMERLNVESGPGDGSLASSWATCTLGRGGANVGESFKDRVVATPGEPNSN